MNFYHLEHSQQHPWYPRNDISHPIENTIVDTKMYIRYRYDEHRIEFLIEFTKPFAVKRLHEASHPVPKPAHSAHQAAVLSNCQRQSLIPMLGDIVNPESRGFTSRHWTRDSDVVMFFLCFRGS